MTVTDLQNALSLAAVTLPEGDREAEGVYIGDLLSWVMGFWLQKMEDISLYSRKFRLWAAICATLIVGVCVFILLAIPSHACA